MAFSVKSNNYSVTIVGSAMQKCMHNKDTGAPCIKEVTRGETANAPKFTHKALFPEALSHLPWVNPLIHAGPGSLFQWVRI